MKQLSLPPQARRLSNPSPRCCLHPSCGPRVGVGSKQSHLARLVHTWSRTRAGALYELNATLAAELWRCLLREGSGRGGRQACPRYGETQRGGGSKMAREAEVES